MQPAGLRPTRFLVEFLYLCWELSVDSDGLGARHFTPRGLLCLARNRLNAACNVA